MPVGRFVCDVHGESRSVWPLNDALCAALQIINHIQDCQADYRNLDRVYIPQDALAEAGAHTEEIGAAHASPALLECLHGLAARTDRLLADSDGFAVAIADTRLGLEVAVINTLAHRLTQMLQTRDPLRDRVHLSAPAAAAFTLLGVLRGGFGRLGRRFSAAAHKPRGA
jgi:phytoene/squalene synthetase